MVRVDIAVEVAEWLQKLRAQSRLSISEAARQAMVSEELLIGWETGFPVPLVDFLILMKVYGVGSMLAGARVTAWQSKFLER